MNTHLHMIQTQHTLTFTHTFTLSLSFFVNSVPHDTFTHFSLHHPSLLPMTLPKFHHLTPHSIHLFHFHPLFLAITSFHLLAFAPSLSSYLSFLSPSVLSHFPPSFSSFFYLPFPFTCDFYSIATPSLSVLQSNHLSLCLSLPPLFPSSLPCLYPSPSPAYSFFSTFFLDLSTTFLPL